MSFHFTRTRTETQKSQTGFTMVEVIVALTILAAGSAVLWYGIQSASKMEMLNRLHHAAVLAARSDLESLRGVSKKDIHDTSYFASGTAPESLLVVRRVMDSAKILNTFSEIILDEKLSPKELRKPLEVQVSVFRVQSATSEIEFPPSDFSADGQAYDSEGRKLLISLTLKVPEYKWY